MGNPVNSFERFIYCFLIAIFATSFSLVIRAQPLAEVDEEWVEATLDSLSLEQKAGQVLCRAIGYNQKADGGFVHRSLISSARDLYVGAFHISGGKAEEVARLINSLQDAAEIPLIITADMEGGLGSALSGATLFPKGMALASTGDPELVRMCARAAAEEGRAAGIGINYYPVLDVNTDPGNNIINYRAFGDKPAIVAKYGIAYMEGTQSAGIMATGKHFPGHGHTSIDSHTGRVVIGLGESEFRTMHLAPFQRAIEGGIDAIMTGHIIVPSLGESFLPATLSKRLTTKVLRNELGFDGLIITDAMSMGAITNYFSQEEAAVMALSAGADLIIFPPDPAKYSRAIQDAVLDGTIPTERLDDAVRRVLRAKSRLRLSLDRFVDLDALSFALKTEEHVRLSNRAAAESIILHRDRSGRFPLNLENADVTLLEIGDLGMYPYKTVGQGFVGELQSRAKSVEVFYIGGSPTEADLVNVTKSAESSDIIFCNVFLTVSASKNRIDLSEAKTEIVESLRQYRNKAVLCVFGSPYEATFFPWFDCVVISCDTMWEMQRAAIRAMVGENQFKGKLPVVLDRYRSEVGGFREYR